MCYGMNCPYEKRNGDCKLSEYPKGFVCPPDREDDEEKYEEEQEREC